MGEALPQGRWGWLVFTLPTSWQAHTGTVWGETVAEAFVIFQMESLFWHSRVKTKIPKAKFLKKKIEHVSFLKYIEVSNGFIRQSLDLKSPGK